MQDSSEAQARGRRRAAEGGDAQCLKAERPTQQTNTAAVGRAELLKNYKGRENRWGRERYSCVCWGVGAQGAGRIWGQRLGGPAGRWQLVVAMAFNPSDWRLTGCSRWW